jgi:parallel beta-helix repeat protein
LIAMLAGSALFAGKWYQAKRAAPGASAAPSGAELIVTDGADRGAGSLREALFVAAGPGGKATIVIRVDSIRIETALPPLVNPQGISLVAPETGVVIDAQALKDAPVFDIAGPNVSLTGLTIRNCSGAAVLVRASLFRMASSTIESCDVGVDVAENVNDLSLARNRFTKNRIGVRLAASGRNASVTGNQFAGHTDAGIWAVRSTPDAGTAVTVVRDNRFSDDHIGVLAGNLSLQLEENDLIGSREAAIHVLGAGVVARRNRITGGAAMGIVGENARAATIESNELDRVTAYAIMLRGSSDTLVRDNRIHNCGYGMAFVLGDTSNPSTAVDNSIIGARFNGIDVIGDSPILRRNRVVNPRALALHVTDFQPPEGPVVRANPFLEDNNFGTDKTRIIAESSAQPDASERP